jgi:hypothetical protein
MTYTCTRDMCAEHSHLLPVNGSLLPFTCRLSTHIACTCICHTMYIAFTLCMSYKIYTTHRQHIYNTYTTHIQHIYNAYRTHIQHICNTYITHIQHIYHTYITHTQHIYRIHMYTSYNIETDIRGIHPFIEAYIHL